MQHGAFMDDEVKEYKILPCMPALQNMQHIIQLLFRRKWSVQRALVPYSVSCQKGWRHSGLFAQGVPCLLISMTTQACFHNKALARHVKLSRTRSPTVTHSPCCSSLHIGFALALPTAEQLDGVGVLKPKAHLSRS